MVWSQDGHSNIHLLERKGKKSSKAKMGSALKHLSLPLLKDFPRIHPKSIVLLIFHSHNCVIWPIYWQES